MPQIGSNHQASCLDFAGCVTKTLIWDGERCSHLESFLLSSDRWKQQLPVLPITTMERLQGYEMGEEIGEGVKQKHRAAADDDDRKKKYGEIRGTILQWTAKAYKSCSTNKMVYQMY